MAKPVALGDCASMRKSHDYQCLRVRDKLSTLIGTRQWQGQQVNDSGFKYKGQSGNAALEEYLEDNMSDALWTKWRALPLPVFRSYVYGFYRCSYESALKHGYFDGRNTALGKPQDEQSKVRHIADKILQLDEAISSQEALNMAEAHTSNLLSNSTVSYCSGFSHQVARYISICTFM